MKTFKLDPEGTLNKEKLECLRKDTAYLKAMVHANIDLLLMTSYPGDKDLAEFLTSQEVG